MARTRRPHPQQRSAGTGGELRRRWRARRSLDAQSRPPLGRRWPSYRRRSNLGALVACSAGHVPLPVGTEDRIAAFAQRLISVAIENAETREELAASRARLVKAADDARRRIERNLHDGAQQRLLSTAVTLTLLQRQLDRDPDDARALLESAREQLSCGLAEFRSRARPSPDRAHGPRTRSGSAQPRPARAVPRRPPRRNARPAGRDDRGRRLLRRSEALTNVAKYGKPPRCTWPSSTQGANFWSRSQMTASAAPTRHAGRAFAAWSTGSKQSAAGWKSQARPVRERDCTPSCRQTCRATTPRLRSLAVECRLVPTNQSSRPRRALCVPAPGTAAVHDTESAAHASRVGSFGMNGALCGPLATGCPAAGMDDQRQRDEEPDRTSPRCSYEAIAAVGPAPTRPPRQDGQEADSCGYSIPGLRSEAGSSGESRPSI